MSKSISFLKQDLTKIKCETLKNGIDVKSFYFVQSLKSKPNIMQVHIFGYKWYQKSKRSITIGPKNTAKSSSYCYKRRENNQKMNDLKWIDCAMLRGNGISEMPYVMLVENIS